MHTKQTPKGRENRGTPYNPCHKDGEFKGGLCSRPREWREAGNANRSDQLRILQELQQLPYLIAAHGPPLSQPPRPLPTLLSSIFTQPFPTPHLAILGLAKIHPSSPVFFLPVIYPSATLARRKLGLPRHLFHITIGYADGDEYRQEERAWDKLVWIQRDGRAAREIIEECEAWLKRGSSVGTQSVDKEWKRAADEVAAETILEICTIVLKDPAWIVAYVVSDPACEQEDLSVKDSTATVVDLLCLRSRMHGRLGALELALADALEAFQMAPDSPLCAGRAAAACLACGDKKRAAEHVLKGLAMSPNDPFLLHLAVRVNVSPPTLLSPPSSSVPNRFASGCKFPRTPHLLALSPSISRDDLILHGSDTGYFLSRPVTIEEKIDGANLGVSVDPDSGTLVFRNRGKYVTSATASQWAALDRYFNEQGAWVRQVLGALPVGSVVFGEWMWAVHSVEYDSLPGYFIVFDIWEPMPPPSVSAGPSVTKPLRIKQHSDPAMHSCGKFWSTPRRNALISSFNGSTVPLLASDVSLTALDDLRTYLGRTSKYGRNKIEGIYVRVETADGEWLERRAKVVAQEFVQCIEVGGHWSRKEVRRNKVKF
ncbi:hypothetical protein HK104_009586 [Borealophlyctis nickersoniae]|nr:hypothetical protein HK104_009586 [Borealophlyctis nickersoniae]